MADEVPPCPVVRVLSPQSIAQGPERAYAALQVPVDRREEAFSAALDEAQKLVVEASEPWWWKWLSDLLTAHVEEHGARDGIDSGEDEAIWHFLLSERIQAAIPIGVADKFKSVISPLITAPPSTEEDVKLSAEFCAEEAFRQRLLKADSLPSFLLSLGVNCADIEGAFKRLLAEAGLHEERKDEVDLGKEAEPVTDEWGGEPEAAGEVVWEDDESANDDDWGDESGEGSESKEENGVDEGSQALTLEDDDAAIQRLVEEEVAAAAEAKRQALEAAGIAPEPPKKERRKSAKKIAEEKAAAKEAAKALAPAAAKRAAAILMALKGLKALGVPEEVFAGALGVSRATVNNLLNEKRGARLSGTDREFTAILDVAMNRARSFAELVDFLETEAGRPLTASAENPETDSTEAEPSSEDDDGEWADDDWDDEDAEENSEADEGVNPTEAEWGDEEESV